MYAIRSYYDVLFWTRRDARSQGVRFEVSGVAGLPPIRADRHQLKQVFLNLVMNAIHAMPDGGTVSISATVAGAMAHLEVADTGAGIAPEMLPRLFEPFFTTRRDGSGIGLAIVRKIVEDHGVITSYSIHYTKLYDCARCRRLQRAESIVSLSSAAMGQVSVTRVPWPGWLVMATVPP